MLFMGVISRDCQSFSYQCTARQSALVTSTVLPQYTKYQMSSFPQTFDGQISLICLGMAGKNDVNLSIVSIQKSNVSKAPKKNIETKRKV